MKLLRQLHRWVGLVLGMFLAVLGLSGSWLVYERELASPPFVLVPSTQALPLETLYQVAASRLPDTDIVIRFPRSGNMPYQFWAGEQQLVMDQYSGEVLAIRDAEFWPYGWIFHLHTELLLGTPGEVVTGWLAVGLLLLIVIGVLLWWPRHWKHALRLRLNKSRFLFHLDLHQQVGIAVAPALLLAAVTGLSLSWSSTTTDTINAIFRGHESDLPGSIADRINRPVVTLDAVMTVANQGLVGGRIGIMVVPASFAKPVIVRKQMDGEPHPNGLNFIYVGRGDDASIKVIPLARAAPAKRWFNWAYPLHTGQALQPWHAWVLLACGLLPAILLATGICMYLIRRKLIAQH